MSISIKQTHTVSCASKLQCDEIFLYQLIFLLQLNLKSANLSCSDALFTLLNLKKFFKISVKEKCKVVLILCIKCSMEKKSLLSLIVVTLLLKINSPPQPVSVV